MYPSLKWPIAPALLKRAARRRGIEANFRRVRYLGEQLARGLSRGRMHRVRRDLAQGLQHEAAQVHARVGEAQARGRGWPYHHPVEHQEVYIDYARAVREEALAAHVAFDFEQVFEQLTRSDPEFQAVGPQPATLQ